MKPEQKIKVLAELDGWTQLGNGLFAKSGYHGRKLLSDFSYYLTSYDAIIPLIQRQSDIVKNEFAMQLIYNTASPDSLYSETPEQLSDALIKAVGKWEDDQ